MSATPRYATLRNCTPRLLLSHCRPKDRRDRQTGIRRDSEPMRKRCVARNGVVTPPRVVVRIVKTNSTSSVVLLLPIPTMRLRLGARNRDEGIVEGTIHVAHASSTFPSCPDSGIPRSSGQSGLTGSFPVVWRSADDAGGKSQGV